LYINGSVIIIHLISSDRISTNIVSSEMSGICASALISDLVCRGCNQSERSSPSRCLVWLVAATANLVASRRIRRHWMSSDEFRLDEMSDIWTLPKAVLQYKWFSKNDSFPAPFNRFASNVDTVYFGKLKTLQLLKSQQAKSILLNGWAVGWFGFNGVSTQTRCYRMVFELCE